MTSTQKGSQPKCNFCKGQGGFIQTDGHKIACGECNGTGASAAASQPDDELQKALYNLKLGISLSSKAPYPVFDDSVVGRAFEQAEAAIRQWAVGVAPEKKTVTNYDLTKSVQPDIDDFNIGFNDAIDQYKRNLMGEK